jgi:predicted ester cyclase
MKSSAAPNVELLHRYRQAFNSLCSPAIIASFLAPDVVVQVFPNRIAPHGQIRRSAELRPAYEQGLKILRSQTYKIMRVLNSGDDIVSELEWSGILAVPVMDLPAGTEIKAFVARFVTFRDGKIISQRNYDCYPPFGAQPAPPAS